MQTRRPPGCWTSLAGPAQVLNILRARPEAAGSAGWGRVREVCNALSLGYYCGMQVRKQRWEVAALVVTCAVGFGGELGCGGSNKPAESPASAPQGDDAGADETEAMAEIDEYLAEEGSTDEEDAAEAKATGEQPAAEPSTSQERKEDIAKLIKAKRGVVGDCYKAAKKDNPSLGTRIAITFVLKPDGSIKTGPSVDKARSDIEDPKVVECAIEVVKGIQYPAHPQGMETTFTYPFGF